MFDKKYCIKECSIGKLKSEELLKESDSIFDAVYDFESFLDDCRKTCKYQNTKKTEAT